MLIRRLLLPIFPSSLRQFMLRSIALGLFACAFGLVAVNRGETGISGAGETRLSQKLRIARDRYEAMKHVGPGGLPPLALTKAFAQMKAMPGPKLGTPKWTFLGPSMINNGQTLTGTCNGGNAVYGMATVAGRVTAIGFGSGNTTYIGSAHGGVWANNGSKWIPLSDTEMVSSAVGALAVIPGTGGPATDILYAYR